MEIRVYHQFATKLDCHEHLLADHLYGGPPYRMHKENAAHATQLPVAPTAVVTRAGGFRKISLTTIFERCRNDCDVAHLIVIAA